MSNEHEHSVLGSIIVPVGIESNRKRSESLSSEWDTQARNMARRFAEILGLSTKDYIETLPKFTRKPRNFNGEHGIPAIPVIVEARIPLAEMLNTVRIDPFFDPQENEDWTEGDFASPREPYITYLTYLPNKSIQEVRANLGKNQRGGTALEGIALFLKQPEILNHYSLMLPGSQIGSDCAPFLFALPNPEAPNPRREGRPNHPSLNRGSIDKSSPKSACLIASRI